MKRNFVTGILVGALLFGAIPAFAGNLVGSKVTGLYTIEQNGKKIADGAIINNSAYVPVRTMAEATGTTLQVEGKKIILGVQSKASLLEELEFKKTGVKRDVETERRSIEQYETDFLPRAKERYQKSIGTETEEQDKKTLDQLTLLYEEYKSKLAQLEAELKDIESQIESLK